ncbi:hypothetical protein K502DRAFT_111241 [Neoconidiobolus thromboides FSU 785]|nr:hypothetical protein K502DRAFT_111241 [Neoconidiobolus thromboides FSU 785]
MSYVETFMKEKPKIGLEIMGARVKKSKQLDEELSDFFRERAQIEELYSKQLLKLAKKSYITEKGMFNHLDSILSKLQKEVEEISINHQTLSQNITKKVDKIVRESTNIHLDSSSIRLIEGNSQRLTKEYEEKSAKIAKLQKSIKSKSRKNETTSKIIIYENSIVF